MKTREKELERLAKQGKRQQLYRNRMKSERKPSRDHISRVAFHYLIQYFYERNQLAELNGFIIDVVSLLERQGFDKVASATVFDDIIDKYTVSNWQFRRKPHLNTQPSDDLN